MRFALVFLLALASNAACAQGTLKAASTPAGQPASGLNSGKWEGIAVELLTEMLKTRRIEFMQMNFAELQDALTSSQVDVIAAAFGITPERAEVVDFTKPYGSFRDVLLLPEADKNTYQALSDLKGKRIASSRGGAYVKPLIDAGVNLVEVNNPAAGITALQAGRVEGVVDNGLQLRFRIKQMNLTGLRIVDSYTPITEGKLAYAVRKGDTNLLSTLDAALTKAEQDGLLKRLKEKWLID
jgi:polar amino acid transport system substrate-binding protein